MEIPEVIETLGAFRKALVPWLVPILVGNESWPPARANQIRAIFFHLGAQDKAFAEARWTNGFHSATRAAEAALGLRTFAEYSALDGDAASEAQALLLALKSLRLREGNESN